MSEPVRLHLPDTNVLSRFMRGVDPGLHARMVEHAGSLRLSSLVWFELRYGAERHPSRGRIEQRLERLREFIGDIVPFGEEAAWQAARVRAHLAGLKPGALPIGPYDVLIAGHALALGAVLVTHNRAEFARVPGLLMEDWQS